MRSFLYHAAFLAAIFPTGLLPGAALAEERAIDTERSTITVRVSKCGSPSAAEGDYVIQVPLMDGSFDTSVPHMQLAIDARRMRVLARGLSASERQEVQERMFGEEVLDVDRFAWISFHSIEIQAITEAEWLIRGELGLRGQFRATPVRVVPGGGRYKGSTTIRLSDYGIARVSLARGAVVLKDEVTIDFDIVVAGGSR